MKKVSIAKIIVKALEYLISRRFRKAELWTILFLILLIPILIAHIGYFANFIFCIKDFDTILPEFFVTVGYYPIEFFCLENITRISLTIILLWALFFLTFNFIGFSFANKSQDKKTLFAGIFRNWFKVLLICFVFLIIPITSFFAVFHENKTYESLWDESPWFESTGLVLDMRPFPHKTSLQDFMFYLTSPIPWDWVGYPINSQTTPQTSNSQTTPQTSKFLDYVESQEEEIEKEYKRIEDKHNRVLNIFRWLGFGSMILGVLLFWFFAGIVSSFRIGFFRALLMSLRLSIRNFHKIILLCVFFLGLAVLLIKVGGIDQLGGFLVYLYIQQTPPEISVILLIFSILCIIFLVVWFACASALFVKQTLLRELSLGKIKYSLQSPNLLEISDRMAEPVFENAENNRD